MDNYMIAGIVLFVVFAIVALWVARLPSGEGPRCPTCKGPSSWRTCSENVAPAGYTAAICGRCNRIGGAR